jgi:hypothetical protein
LDGKDLSLELSASTSAVSSEKFMLSPTFSVTKIFQDGHCLYNCLLRAGIDLSVQAMRRLVNQHLTDDSINTMVDIMIQSISEESPFLDGSDFDPELLKAIKKCHSLRKSATTSTYSKIRKLYRSKLLDSMFCDQLCLEILTKELDLVRPSTIIFFLLLIFIVSFFLV